MNNDKPESSDIIFDEEKNTEQPVDDVFGDEFKKPVKKKTGGKRSKRFNLYRAVLVFLFTSFFATAVYIYATAMMRDNPDITTYMEPRKRIIEIEKVIRKPGETVFGDKDQILILCLGLDENRDHRGIGYTKGSRTDTIFILNLDKKAEKIGILSIPRDIWIYRGEAYGYGKINSVYAEAFWNDYDRNQDYEQAKMAGLMSARKTIEEFLGVEIDHFVLLKIKASREMVDAIGGISVNVEKDMDYDDNWGKLHIHLKQGKQRLNGEQAVGYARFRHDEEGDWGRIRRQQQVIQSLARELKKPIHIMHINSIAKVIKENMDTDLEFAQLVDLANVYKDFNRDNIVKGIITGYDDWAGGGAVVVPHEDEKVRLVRRILSSPTEIFPEDLRVRVLDRSNVIGLGDAIADRLRRQGYFVVEVTQDSPWIEPSPSPSPSPTDSPEDGETQGYEQAETPSPEITPSPSASPEEKEMVRTHILDHYHNDKGAKMLENAIGYHSGEVLQESNRGHEYPIDFTIVVGHDYKDEDYVPQPTPTYTFPKLETEGSAPGSFEVIEK